MYLSCIRTRSSLEREGDIYGSWKDLPGHDTCLAAQNIWQAQKNAVKTDQIPPGLLLTKSILV